LLAAGGGGRAGRRGRARAWGGGGGGGRRPLPAVPRLGEPGPVAFGFGVVAGLRRLFVLQGDAAGDVRSGLPKEPCRRNLLRPRGWARRVEHRGRGGGRRRAGRGGGGPRPDPSPRPAPPRGGPGGAAELWGAPP